MNKKYELLKNDTVRVSGKTLYRMKLLRDIGPFTAGNLGAYIESEDNLDHAGNAWVYGDAWKRPPLYIQGPVYALTVSTAEKVSIGCECHTLPDWADKFKALCEYYGIPDNHRPEYWRMLAYAEIWMKAEGLINDNGTRLQGGEDETAV
ncbi:hypothetical protein GF374_03415 [Candidatus Woesearchaeota archaeon]|nr:hypothetical protein [Candidatus Woesearchaeota archaeon]